MRKPILLLLLLLFYFKASAAVFVVTSNADSGPGTLRDALTQAAANGTAEKDYINFNLPGTGIDDITITLKTQLPDVTGNLVIDGTTQPGNPLGVSDAKVIITVADATKLFTIFNGSAYTPQNTTLAYYGLYIKGFATSSYVTAINNINAQLTVGSPGKGNVISGVRVGVIGSLFNGIIQSNFWGIEPDGETLFENGESIFGDDQFPGLLIGGDDPSDGNVFSGGTENTIGFGIGSEQGGSSATIKNNFFGTDYTGKTALGYNFNASIYVNDSYSLTITDNVFSASQPAITAFNSASITVKGNYFGTDRSQTVAIGNGGTAINLNSHVSATIGGNDAADQNVFTGYDNPFFSINYSLINIIKNSFYCNNSVYVPDEYNSNYVRIIKLLDNEASGDAPPGATVQLYYTTSQCPNCNPTTWFATVTADANGVWDYKGDTRQNIMISSTLGDNTFGFQPYTIALDEVTVVDSDCHHPGSIEINEKRQGRFQFLWKDSKGKIIGTDQKIDNLATGTYFLQINEGGNCPVASGQFNVNSLKPHVYAQTFQLDCNNAMANFTSYPVVNPQFSVTNYYWEDSTGKIISTESSVKNLPAGNYYLYITDSNGCNSDTALYQVLPPVPIPVIDSSKMVNTPANCNFSDGSITGISVSNMGVNDYGWSKSDGTIVAYDQLDLKNMPPGEYYFFIYYSFSCPPVQSALFVIGTKNGITINDDVITIKPASCNKSNGAVINLKTTNATQYQWVDANGKTVATTLNLENVPAGRYTLTASNITCSQSKNYTVKLQTSAPLPVYPFSITQACFQQSNGSITVTTDALVTGERWVNNSGTTVGNSAAIDNIAAGTYQLYLTDQNGCENYYQTYIVSEYPEFTVAAYGTVTDDQCGLSLGGISATTIAGGVPPYTYKWTDATGKQISTDNTIQNQPTGSYTLNVVDAGCGNVDITYTINEQSQNLPAPVVANVQLCSSGSALLSVTNPSASTIYRLYDSPSAVQPLQEQKGGHFNVNVSGNRSYYITQVSGNCESIRAEMDVTVGLSDLNIANTFTPNGDGINDYWQINGITNYPAALVQIFNRYGQMLFESKGYSIPFDGTYKGQKLPAGVYYYIINLNTKCNLLSGSLTIIR